MISRYRTGKFLPLCYFYSNTVDNGNTTNTQAGYTVVVKCAPGATVGFKVTNYAASHANSFYMVDSVTKVLNDSFNKVDTGTGSITLTILLGYTSAPAGSAVNVELSIENVSTGKLGSPLQQSEVCVTS